MNAFFCSGFGIEEEAAKRAPRLIRSNVLRNGDCQPKYVAIGVGSTHER